MTNWCQFSGCSASVSRNFVCQDSSMDLKSGKYCSMHVCPVENCGKAVLNVKKSEACTDHTCTALGCVNCVANVGSTGCVQHLCMSPGCPAIMLPGKDGCFKHACCIAGCRTVTNGRAPFLRCRNHSCNALGCQLSALDGRRYCPDHACAYRDIIAKDKACTKLPSACQREGYKYLSGDVLCMHHICTQGDCKNARARHQALCLDCLRSQDLAAAIVQLAETQAAKPPTLGDAVPPPCQRSGRLGYLKITKEPTPRPCPYQLRSRAGKQKLVSRF